MLDRISEVSRWFDRMFAGIGKASKSIMIYFFSCPGGSRQFLSVCRMVSCDFTSHTNGTGYTTGT
jgi:hypothetical protein